MTSGSPASSVYWFETDEKQTQPVFITTENNKIKVHDSNGNLVSDFAGSCQIVEMQHALTNDVLLLDSGSWKILYLPDTLTQFLNLIEAQEFQLAEKLLEENSPHDFEDENYSYETCMDMLYQKWLEFSLKTLGEDQEATQNPDKIVQTLSRISSKLPYGERATKIANFNITISAYKALII